MIHARAKNVLIGKPRLERGKKSYDLFVTPRQKKYEIVVRCAKVELGLSK
jgi:hypothetical protein